MRVQGIKFKALRPFLKMDNYIITSNGNIRVNLRYKSNGQKIHHYLTDAEYAKFIKSDYFKAHEPIQGSKNNLWAISL